jgi:hypothetical protein
MESLERFSTTFVADYRFGPLNILLLLMICLAGLGLHLTSSAPVRPHDNHRRARWRWASRSCCA